MSLQKIKAEYEDLLEQHESGDSHWHKLFVSNVKDKLKSVQSRIGPSYHFSSKAGYGFETQLGFLAFSS